MGVYCDLKIDRERKRRDLERDREEEGGRGRENLGKKLDKESCRVHEQEVFLLLRKSYPAHQLIILSDINLANFWRQSYRRNFILKRLLLVLKSITVH
jgi:hypothetical protein